MRDLITASLLRTRSVMMLLALILLTGFASYMTIPRESSPDITIPVIYVSVHFEGISPEDAERLLVLPLEKELRAIEGLKEMSATASQSHASVVLEFIAGMDTDEVLADVRDKVNLAKSKLPKDTDEPEIHQITFASMAPVITAVLSGNLPERALVKMARELKDVLESRKQILEVDIAGDREEVVDVIIDPLKLESYGLIPSDVINLVAQNNQLVAAGNVDNGKGRFSVKVPAVYKTPADILSQPVKADGDRVITFADIATVLSTFKEGGGYARMNGQNSVALEIKKRPGENIIETVALAKAIIAEGQKLAPDTLIVDYVGDQSTDIVTMVNDLQNSVLSAIIFVVTVIIGALGFRSAVLAAVAIPGSFLAGILIIAMMGLTINMIVLFSLMMAVGMLVDGAVVVTEFADRKMTEGVPRRQAYRDASIRMSWPIIASTATTLAAFFPLMFWPGIMGEMMKYLPLTLIATLASSLVMALIFIPTIGAVFGKPRKISNKEQQAIVAAESGNLLDIPGLTGFYIRSLSKAIQHPLKILAAGLASVFIIYVAFIQFGKGSEFFPDVDTDSIVVKVKVNSSNLSIDEKDDILKRVEAIILKEPELETLYARTGDNQEVGTLRLNMVDWKFRRKAAEITEDLKVKLSHFAGLDISIERQKDGPPQGKPLELVVTASSLEVLHDSVRKVRLLLSETDGFINVEDDGPTPGYEWRIDVNRANAARYGADVSSAGGLIRMVTSGLTVGSYRPDDSSDEVDIRIRFPETDRHLESIDQLRLMTQAGLVPINNFMTREIVPKVDSIKHQDGKRSISITANLSEGLLLNDLLPVLKKQLEALDLPRDVRFQFKGQNEEQEESGQFLVKAFTVALFVMAMILVTQFNSFYQASLIMSAVILSTGGVFLGLLLAGKPFGIVMCGIGVISLAGIVVNNNIVLIDTYNVLRSRGMKAEEAILRTGAQRLRPVMLTTVTTILGLMPMVLSTNIDLLNHSLEIGGPTAQWWNQLSTAIAGGLAFATVLTLILTPCLLVIAGKKQDRKLQP
ncbi:efflux RND transporter permease subunit [uncultured Endozoicomonas sp.]|uniref:efflux RND transporter permease subunit n=1 Tax=uncultured Endozoicomonas sp. TaxID=432652 RepID=UPI00260234DB|nr:efflux RND transporter permease subunit [uncultured Endozoicomonas sp.]